jgi:hypothetical protein
MVRRNKFILGKRHTHRQAFSGALHHFGTTAPPQALKM